METLFACLLAVIAAAGAGQLPKNVTPCKLSDADYKKCVIKQATEAVRAFANGDRSLGVPPLEPLNVNRLTIESLGFTHDYFDLKFHNLSTCQFTDISIDKKDPFKLKFQILLPEVALTGNYKATGKLLLFTLNGKGKYKLFVKNLKVNFDASGTHFTKGDATYVRLGDVKVTLDPEKLNFDYENLIDGNAELSAEILKVLNENDLDVFKEVKPAYEESFAQVFRPVIGAVFEHVPLDVLFPK